MDYISLTVLDDDDDNEMMKSDMPWYGTAWRQSCYVVHLRSTNRSLI